MSDRFDTARSTTMKHSILSKLSFPRPARYSVPCMVCATALVALYVFGQSAFGRPASLDPRAAAQDKDKAELKPMSDSQREMIELFGKVETRLHEIDRLLSDAGAGDTSALKQVGPSGIDELLKRSKEQGEQAIQDIDKILELAQKMQQEQQSSSGQGQGKPKPGQGQGQGQPQQQGQQDGQNPLDGQGSTTTQREQTPSTPDQPGGQEPKDKDGKGGKDGTKPKGENDKGEDGKGDSKKDGDKPKGDGSPKDPSASKSDAKNQPSGPPPGSGRGAASSTADGKERWGDLPVHARDVFRNEGGRDMPVQYRDWIDAYYRRLNKKGP